METIRMSYSWGGPTRDVLAVIDVTAPEFSAALLDDYDDPEVVVYRVLDHDEEPNGDIVGIEIVGFLDFDRWEEIPVLPMRWSIGDGPARSPREALHDLQERFRRAGQLAHAS